MNMVAQFESISNCVFSLLFRLDTVKFVKGHIEATNKNMQRTSLKFDRFKLYVFLATLL